MLWCDEYAKSGSIGPSAARTLSVEVSRVSVTTMARQCLARLQVEKPSVVTTTQAPNPEISLKTGYSHLTACYIT